MAAKKPLKWMVTANFTEDGAVAYLREDQSWSGKVAEVFVFETQEAAEAARRLALKLERIVSDPYVIEIAPEAGSLDLLTARERIRASGPSVRLRRPDPLSTGR
jgi:Protein of unknown function (DUF2849)